MRRFFSLLVLAAMLTGLAGCGQEQTQDPVPEEPLMLESLAVEISKNGLSTERLLQAKRELPKQLQTAFSQAGVDIGQVTVTIGSSPDATAQALKEGTVDLAFLPAEDFLRVGGSAVLLADAPQPALTPEASDDPADWNGAENARSYDENGTWEGGTFALICTAPTEYGRQLAQRDTPTWEELDHARWGVLGEESLGGYQCLELWLEDAYEGNQITDLADVTTYESYEALFRAAAAGDIDAFPIRADARMDVAEAWTLSPLRTAESGMQGFDREESVWDEVQVIAVTEPLYATLAAVPSERTELTDGRFAAALEQVLSQLGIDAPEQMEVLGCSHFAPLADEALDPLRRLMTARGEALGGEMP